MIQASELRIGNLVNPNIGELDHIAEISSIGLDCCWLSLVDENYEEWLSIEHERETKYLTPIPLTEEWLVKFWFALNDDYVSKEHLWNDYVKDGIRISLPYLEYSTDDISTEIKHVHQLQNLYHALTGKELTPPIGGLNN